MISRRFRHRILDVATVLCVVVAAYSFWSNQHAQSSGRTGNQNSVAMIGKAIAPIPITFRSSTGEAANDTLVGPALIYVFKSNCPACAAQKPEWLKLVSVAESSHVHSFAFSPEGLDSLTEAYFAQSGVTVASAGLSGAGLSQFAIQVVPTTIVLGADSKIKLFHSGVMGVEEVTALRTMLTSSDQTR